MSKLETDKKTQKMFDILLKNHPSEELLMIVLPIHLSHNNLFKECIDDLRKIQHSKRSIDDENQDLNSNQKQDSNENQDLNSNEKQDSNENQDLNSNENQDLNSNQKQDSNDNSTINDELNSNENQNLNSNNKINSNQNSTINDKLNSNENDNNHLNSTENSRLNLDFIISSTESLNSIDILSKSSDKLNDDTYSKDISDLTTQNPDTITDEEIFDDFVYDPKSPIEYSQYDDQTQLKIQLETVLTNVSEITLNNSLAHYSRMIKTASPDLMNSIFIISSLIVSHVSSEKIKEPLEIIYKSALESFPACPNSIDFISEIVRFNLASEKKEFSHKCDWERSMESVLESLNKLLNENRECEVNITDCNSIQSVYNLLNCRVVPKILPFDEQRKMIEEMKSMIK